MDVQIILGSASDRDVAEKATDVLDEFGIEYEVAVASAHRAPEILDEVVAHAQGEGVKVFIAIAGLAAHLPGVVASKTVKPVIGVPVNTALDGMDALLSIAQMPPGVPVACVGIGRGENAALLAVEILAACDAELAARLEQYRERLAEKVKQDSEKLRPEAKKL